MANNRLYVADPKEKEWVTLAKGWGAGWHVWDSELFNEFLFTRFNEGHFTKTNLIFFDEQHELYDEIMDNYEEYKP